MTIAEIKALPKWKMFLIVVFSEVLIFFLLIPFLSIIWYPYAYFMLLKEDKERAQHKFYYMSYLIGVISGYGILAYLLN